MVASAVVRQAIACALGAFAWWYFYSVDNIFYPPWIGVVVAAFVISLVVVIISDSIALTVLIAIVYYVASTPLLVADLMGILPVFGGTVAGIALWKIL